MEHIRRHEQDQAEALGGTSSPQHREVPKAAGHILLHEQPHNGEIRLNPTQQTSDTGPAFRPVMTPNAKKAPQQGELAVAASHLGAVAANAEQAPARIEHSAWHTIGVDELGNALPQHYGQAFHQERRAEMDAQQQDSPVVSALQSSTQQVTPVVPQLDDPMDPSQSTAFGDVEMPKAVPVPDKPIPANPLYSVVPGSRASTPPAVQQAEPAEQQLSHSPMGGPQQPAMPMTGAVNPSFAQPQMPAEPQLPSGQAADAQHRLPAPQSKLKRVLMSPWLWLAVGIAMIWYFSSGLFN